MRTDRLARVCALACLILVPLVMWLGCADTVETPKRLVVAGLAWIMLAGAFIRPDARRRLTGHPMFVPLAALVVATIFVSRPGVGWSGEEGSWAGGASLAAVWMVALGAAAWMPPGSRRPAAAVVVAACLALGYMAAQAAGWDPVPWDPGRTSSYWLFATLGNPVYLAGILVCAFWASFAFPPGMGGRVVQLALLAGAFATRQRSVWAALAGGALAWWWVARATRRGNADRRVPAGGMMLLLAVAVAVAVAVAAAVIAPGLRLFLPRPGSRVEIWVAAARLWRMHPFLGVGPDAFHAWFPAVARYAFFVADPPTLQGGNVLLRLPASAHNEPLGMAVAGGVLLLGAYAWALAAAVRAGSRSPLLPAAAALWSVHLVNPSSAATGAWCWILFASASADGSADGAPAPDRSPRGWTTAVGAILLAVMTLSLASALGTLVAGAHRREAGRLAFQANRGALAGHLRRWEAWAARGRPGQALADAALWRETWEAQPGDTEALARAMGLLAAARLARPTDLFAVTAAADLETAVGKRRRDPAALRRAEDDLREAIRMAPMVASLHGDLADVLVLEGRAREAAAERLARALRDPRGVFGTPVRP